jgi:hypothetical protein
MVRAGHRAIALRTDLDDGRLQPMPSGWRTPVAGSSQGWEATAEERALLPAPSARPRRYPPGWWEGLLADEPAGRRACCACGPCDGTADDEDEVEDWGDAGGPSWRRP